MEKNPPPSRDAEIFARDKLYLNDDPALDAIGKPSTRNRWRSQGYGPVWIRLGDAPGCRVAYLGAELNQWLSERMAASTTEADAKPTAKRWASRRQNDLRRKLERQTSHG